MVSGEMVSRGRRPAASELDLERMFQLAPILAKESPAAIGPITKVGITIGIY
jgi:hypothetical protein